MHKRIPIILGILLVCFFVWVLITPNPFIKNLVERFEAIGYDLQLRTHVSTNKHPTISPIVIVDIDEKSLKAEGRWPWQRSKLATLIDKLNKLGAAVIAFDMIFPEKEHNVAEMVTEVLSKRNLLNTSTAELLDKSKGYFDEDKVFASEIAEIQPILALVFLSNDQSANSLPLPMLNLTSQENKQLEIFKAFGYVSNIPSLQQNTKNAGFINIFPDSDGIVRRAPLVIQYKQGIYPSLSLQAVMLYLQSNISLFTPHYDQEIKLEGLRLGNHLIPTDVTGQALIPFIGTSFTFPYYSATDVLNNKIDKQKIESKIVFVGTSALGLGDVVSTSIQSPYPGVEIHATLANGMLQDIFSSEPEWTLGAELFLTVVLGLLSAFFFPYFGPRILGIIIILFPPALLLINNYIWNETGLVLSLLAPCLIVLVIALLNIIYGYLFETRKREQLKNMFGQYVPEKHIDEMLKSSGNYGLHGESRELSVLFADIRNFTSLSEPLSASELVHLLNALFTPMTEIIFKHRGTIDKYVGDLIMAFWGAPLKDKHHAQHAISSALEMQKKLQKIREEAKQKNEAEIHIGIGINSGMMNVGDMGSQYRRNYTVLGDAVNLASRVESLTKFYGVNIIVTENTQAHQNKFVFRKLDKVKVKGKKHGVAIYEVMCLQTESSPQLNQELEKFHTAQEYYFQQQWEEALELFNQLHHIFPHTKIYKIYIERIQEFKNKILPEDWDGIYSHETK